MSRSISIIVPVKDGARYLPAALASLLGGELAPDELIVVDDHSSDDSAACARAAGATVITNPGHGPAAARNAGVAASRGELIGFLDADDAATPQRLRVQAALLDDPAIDGAAGLSRNVADRSPAIPSAEHAGEPFRPFTPGTLLLRRAAWHRAGPLDESLLVGDTVEWAVRALRILRWAEHDDVVLLRRVHGENLSASEAAAGGYLRMAHAAIARRRAAEAGR